MRTNMLSRIMAALAATAMSAAEKLDIDKIDKNMAAKTVTYNDIQWFDPADAPFRLSGLNWFKENKLYRRLPKIKGIPGGVDRLSCCTTAVTLAFKSDAQRIVIEAAPARSTMFMHHMASTGVSSFDIYVGGPGKVIAANGSRVGFVGAEAEVAVNSAWVNVTGTRDASGVMSSSVPASIIKK